MAAMETNLLANPADPTAWQQALYAFLAEKERRSGSRRTVEGYSRMLQHFFGQTAKSPDVVTSADVMGWAYGKGLSGRDPSAVTIRARRAVTPPSTCRRSLPSSPTPWRGAGTEPSC